LVKRKNVLPHLSAGKGAVKIKISSQDFNMNITGSYGMTPCNFVVSEGPKFTYFSLNVGVIYLDELTSIKAIRLVISDKQ
jgi:hypothetical protein